MAYTSHSYQATSEEGAGVVGTRTFDSAGACTERTREEFEAGVRATPTRKLCFLGQHHQGDSASSTRFSSWRTWILQVEIYLYAGRHRHASSCHKQPRNIPEKVWEWVWQHLALTFQNSLCGACKNCSRVICLQQVHARWLLVALNQQSVPHPAHCSPELQECQGRTQRRETLQEFRETPGSAEQSERCNLQLKGGRKHNQQRETNHQQQVTDCRTCDLGQERRKGGREGG